MNQPSERTLALLGNAIVDEEFREEFFEDPVGTARRYYADLRENEGVAIAAFGARPNRADIKATLSQLKLQLNCPVYPCPDPLPRLLQ